MAFDFVTEFRSMTGNEPFAWQKRLFDECLACGKIPQSIDVPTGLGKTSVMVIWYLALKQGARLPRRLVYVVDRRTVVDQATTVAEKIQRASGDENLRISTLRGQLADNRAWLEDPSRRAIIVGTVDMIGSRLLFSGYSTSRKMRPYHAGLLGVDTLVLVDEAHLVPPFLHLLRAIEADASLGPKAPPDRDMVPRFIVLPLSATQRNAGGSAASLSNRPTFRLEETDWADDSIAKARLHSIKLLQLKPTTGKKADAQLAKEAWDLAERGGEFRRVVIFCARRDKDEPNAQGVKTALEDLATKTTESMDFELLVGARRNHERDKVLNRLEGLGFIGERQECGKRTFLIATAAGEVGVDVDADDMVSDLVAWERMVQRLGRVNRRGKGKAKVVVFSAQPPAIKNADAPTEAERRAQTAFATKAVLEETNNDLSPWALRRLVDRAEDDVTLREKLTVATTPEPLRPALTHAVVEAWSMTSLETHTGRPKIAPWLRGWIDESPQTALVWRRHLPVPVGANGGGIRRKSQEIDDFFDVAAVHETEKLETESFRIKDFLAIRAKKLLKIKAHVQDADTGADEDDEDFLANSQEIELPGTNARMMFHKHDVFAISLFSDATYHKTYTLDELAKLGKGSEAEVLYGKILVLDARFGGLQDGLLDQEADGEAIETVDATDEWSQLVGFRVRRCADNDNSVYSQWRFETNFVLERDNEGKVKEQLLVERFLDDAQSDEGKSITCRPQALDEHQNQVRETLARMASDLGITGNAAKALEVAAQLHDEGKRSLRWQRAFNAAKDMNYYDLSGPLAKTRGQFSKNILNGYRHEFGSLPIIEEDAAFQALPEDWRDLVLHLVAAHHGQARPVIGMEGCDDKPTSLLMERARDVALRFARQQKRWGPWGLAWWEALLRAADQHASRANDALGPLSRPEKHNE